MNGGRTGGWNDGGCAIGSITIVGECCIAVAGVVERAKGVRCGIEHVFDKIGIRSVVVVVIVAIIIIRVVDERSRRRRIRIIRRGITSTTKNVSHKMGNTTTTATVTGISTHVASGVSTREQ